MVQMSGNGQSKLKLSGNGNECKPLPGTRMPSAPFTLAHASVYAAGSAARTASFSQGLTLVHLSAHVTTLWPIGRFRYIASCAER
jgi:hypothetical protein